MAMMADIREDQQASDLVLSCMSDCKKFSLWCRVVKAHCCSEPIKLQGSDCRGLKSDHMSTYQKVMNLH